MKLYHGTSFLNLLKITHDDIITGNNTHDIEHNSFSKIGVSLTSNINSAFTFSQDAAHISNEYMMSLSSDVNYIKGVVIQFELDDLTKSFNIEKVNGDQHQNRENEYRVLGNITDATKHIFNCHIQPDSFYYMRDNLNNINQLKYLIPVLDIIEIIY